MFQWFQSGMRLFSFRLGSGLVYDIHRLVDVHETGGTILSQRISDSCTLCNSVFVLTAIPPSPAAAAKE